MEVIPTNTGHQEFIFIHSNSNSLVFYFHPEFNSLVISRVWVLDSYIIVELTVKLKPFEFIILQMNTKPDSGYSAGVTEN